MSQESDATGGDLSGQLLDGRYRIERELAKGGMATVYLALDERLSRHVALKVPHAPLLATPGFRERFQAEIRSLTTLSHPNIVEIIDVGEVDGTPYAVLQYVEANTLEARMAEVNRPMTVSEVTSWLGTAAGALDFIHAQGLLHRDVKPGNILFDQSGNLYLTDFGIVKAVGEKPSRHSTAGGRPGSPAYMGPEVATDAVLGPAYDLYGLAVTVYEALGGVLPWRGQSEVKALATKLQAEVPPLPATVPPAVDRVVRKALERKPAARQSSCKAFADEFAAAAAAAPAAAPAAAEAPPEVQAGESSTRATPRLEETWQEGVDTTKPGVPGTKDAGSMTRAYDPSRGFTSAGAVTPAAEPAPRAPDSQTRAVNVAARVKKGPSKPLLFGVGAMVLLLVVAIVAKMGGKEEGPAAVPLPKVKLQSPRPDVVINDPLVTVRGTVNETVTSVLVNEVETEISKSFTFRVDLELETEGTHQIKVVARNAAGQTVESFARVTLDQTPPVLTILKPEADAPKSTRISEFEIVGSLDDKTSRVYFGEERLPLDDEGWFTLYKSLRKEGPHTYAFRAVDRAGNETHAKVEIVLDQTGPEVLIQTPAEKAEVITPAGFVTVSGQVDDPASEVTIAGERARVDDKGLFLVQARVAPEVKEGEAFQVEILARDPAGNEGTASRTFVRGPGLILDTPDDGMATPEGELLVRGTVSDVASPVIVNGKEVRAEADGKFETRVPLGGEGSYDVHVETTDTRGRKTEYDRKVYRDHTMPVFTVTGPTSWNKPDQPFLTSDGSTLDLFGTVEDKSPCRVTLNGVEGTVKDGKWTVEIEARHDMTELVLRVRDAAGNELPAQRRKLTVMAPKFEKLRTVEPDPDGRLRYASKTDASLHFMLVPGGTLQMGAVEGDVHARDEERPRHAVEVGRLLVSPTEVTWRQYLAFVAATEAVLPEERTPAEADMDLPAVGLTLTEVDAYCAWLGARLPTEAEWEWAARGGVEGQVFPWGDDWDNRLANVRGHSKSLAAVGTSGPANGYGLHDVLGNAAELCSEYFAPNAYKTPDERSPDIDPGASADTLARSLRGGTYLDGPENARLSARSGLPAGATEEERALVGFRVVMSAD